MIFIRANIGVAIYPQNGTTSEELIQNANMALLMRSKTNRHQTVFFRSESMDSLNKKYILERVIRQDVTDGMKNFRLVFQPVMEISEGKALWHGAEALLRYHTPRIIYAGSLEPTEKNDTGLHGFVKGEIKNGKIRTAFVPWAVREYKELEIPVTRDTTQYTLTQSVKETMKKMGEENIYTVILEGKRDPGRL